MFIFLLNALPVDGRVTWKPKKNQKKKQTNHDIEVITSHTLVLLCSIDLTGEPHTRSNPLVVVEKLFIFVKGDQLVTEPPLDLFLVIAVKS